MQWKEDRPGNASPAGPRTGLVEQIILRCLMSTPSMPLRAISTSFSTRSRYSAGTFSMLSKCFLSVPSYPRVSAASAQGLHTSAALLEKADNLQKEDCHARAFSPDDRPISFGRDRSLNAGTGRCPSFEAVS